MVYLALYANYLTIDEPKNGFTPIRCPFHEDNNKSAAVNLLNGVFTCQACHYNYSAAKFISAFTGCTVPEAGVIVDTFRQENKIQVNENNFSKKYVFALERSDWKDIYLQSQRNRLEGTFAEEYAEERGISLDTLRKCNVGFLKAEQTPDNVNKDVLTFPYFYNGKIVGIRFRDAVGGKSGLKNSVATLWGIDDVPLTANLVVVVEGESDRLRLIHLLAEMGINLYVVSCPGSFFKAEWERDLDTFDAIALIRDTDHAGEKLEEAFIKQYGKKVKPIKLRWARQQLGKDLSEWLAQNDPTPLVEDLLNFLQAHNTRSTSLSTTDFLTVESETNEEIIKGFLYAGQIGVIGGPQKNKKTWVSLNLVRAILNPGTCFLNIPSLVSAQEPVNVLYLQNEGSRKKFQERVQLLMNGVEYASNAFWLFKPGIKLDDPNGVDRLMQEIEKTKAGVLIIDPFQRMHTKDEDSATDTACVWDALFSLTTKFPKLAIVILHHFGKEKDINLRWNALRGSSRMGGEVDFGLFMQNRPPAEGEGIKLLFEMRDEERPQTEDGKDVFKCSFDSKTGLIYLDPNTVTLSKHEDLIAMVESKGEWSKKDAMAHYGVTEPTFNNWIAKSNGLIKTTPASPGKPVMLKWHG